MARALSLNLIPVFIPKLFLIKKVFPFQPGLKDKGDYQFINFSKIRI